MLQADMGERPRWWWGLVSRIVARLGRNSSKAAAEIERLEAVIDALKKTNEARYVAIDTLNSAIAERDAEIDRLGDIANHYRWRLGLPDLVRSHPSFPNLRDP